MSALLEIEDLEVSFGRTAAVRGASLRIEKGETHCLVGDGLRNLLGTERLR